MASCGCSNTTASITGFKGGKQRKKTRGRKGKSSKKNTKRKRRSLVKRKRRKQGGGGLLGDMSSSAVTISNSLTGSITGNSSVYEQPAGKSYSTANAYMV